MLSLLLAVGCAQKQKGPLSGDYIDMADCDVPVVQEVEDCSIVVLDSNGQPLQIILSRILASLFLYSRILLILPDFGYRRGLRRLLFVT